MITIPSTIQTIIWDFDGTLIDSFEIYVEVLAEAVRILNLTLPDLLVLKQNFHGTLRDSMTNALEINDENIIEQLVEKFLELQENYYALPDEHLIEDAFLLTQRLHASGKRQILVTNRMHAGHGNASPKHIVEHSNLSMFIDQVLASDEVAFRKPDARVLDAIKGKYDLDNALVIGDQFVDAELAHNLGVHAILVDRAGQGIAHIDSLPDAANFQIVKSLDDVMVL
jgi:phosphoglycolate phosphatase-like HAD superfamily hydrolase